MAQHGESVSEQQMVVDEVELRAVAAIVILRENNITDAAILAKYCQPHAEADAEFERRQVAEYGCVLAPAAAVYARMRELMQGAESFAIGN